MHIGKNFVSPRPHAIYNLFPHTMQSLHQCAKKRKLSPCPSIQNTIASNTHPNTELMCTVHARLCLYGIPLSTQTEVRRSQASAKNEHTCIIIYKLMHLAELLTKHTCCKPDPSCSRSVAPRLDAPRGRKCSHNPLAQLIKCRKTTSSPSLRLRHGQPYDQPHLGQPAHYHAAYHDSAGDF